jgi:hypothetical protein
MHYILFLETRETKYHIRVCIKKFRKMIMPKHIDEQKSTDIKL